MNTMVNVALQLWYGRGIFLGKLGAPLWVKLFAWISCKNVMPTTNNLAKRRVAILITFAKGRGKVLLTFYVFCSCSRLPWALSELPWELWEGECEEWMRAEFEELDEEFACFPMVWWMIWNNRNSRLLEGTSEDPSRLLLRTRLWLLLSLKPT